MWLPTALAPALFVLAACAGAPARVLPPADPAPVAAPAIDTARLSARWYRAIPTADSLGGYLRDGSAAGVLVSAHRGGPAPGFPENAIETFERSVQLGPVLLETDVRMTRDSVLVMLHDDALDRTTSGTGALDAQPFRMVRTLFLRDPDGRLTLTRVPTLAETLAWAEGRAILMLDVKRGMPAVKIVGAIRSARAENRVVVIVYNHDDLLTYHQLAPDLNLSMTFATMADVQRMLDMGVNPRRVIAFVGVGAADRMLVGRLRALGIRSQVGTFGAIDDRAARDGATVYDALLSLGVGVLATDQPAIALEAARRMDAARGVRR